MAKALSVTDSHDVVIHHTTQRCRSVVFVVVRKMRVCAQCAVQPYPYVDNNVFVNIVEFNFTLLSYRNME